MLRQYQTTTFQRSSISFLLLLCLVGILNDERNALAYKQSPIFTLIIRTRKSFVRQNIGCLLGVAKSKSRGVSEK